jgi:hypothetical protein
VDLHVAIVGSDDDARLALVKALESAPPTWNLRLYDEPPASAGIVVCDPAMSIPGAIVFDGSPARLLDAVANAKPSAKTFAVTGAGSGVGTTTIALHLAAELSAIGRATALVGDEHVWVRLGLDPSEVPESTIPVASGFRLARSGMDLQTAARVVAEVSDDDVDQTDAAVNLLVFPPSPTGIWRARTILERAAERNWLLVANRLGPGGETTKLQIERMVGGPVIELPCCAPLRDLEDSCSVLTSGWTRWSRAIKRLARMLDAY